MKKLLVCFLLASPCVHGQSKISPLIRGGVLAMETVDPGIYLTGSVLYHTDAGISFGPGIGITKSQVLNNAAVPLFFEITGTSRNNVKIAPLISLQAGYLYGSKTFSGNSKMSGGFMGNVLAGVKLPQKGRKFILVQVGYSLQNYSSNFYEEKSTQKYNGFLGVIGISL